MDPITIGLIVLIVLSLGSFGYGRAYPGAEGVNPLFNLLGMLGLIFIVALVVLLATGWRFGLHVAPPR